MLVKWLDNPATTSWRQKTLTTVLTFSLLIVSGVKANPVEDPNIVMQDGQQVLLLPDKFKDFIKTAFPAFRIPEQEDLIGLWATYIFPFVRWGDFNGDGLTDIAVIIINDQAYKALIAHKTTDDYEIGLMIDERDFDPPEKLGGTSGPQGLSLDRMVKDKQYQFGSNASYARGSVMFSHPLDSVGFTLDEREMTIFFWENGKYEELDV